MSESRTTFEFDVELIIPKQGRSTKTVEIWKGEERIISATMVDSKTSLSVKLPLRSVVKLLVPDHNNVLRECRTVAIERPTTQVQL